MTGGIDGTTGAAAPSRREDSMQFESSATNVAGGASRLPPR